MGSHDEYFYITDRCVVHDGAKVGGEKEAFSAKMH